MTKEELNALKEESEAINKKLAGQTEEELKQVAGGRIRATSYCPECGYNFGERIYRSSDSPHEYCPVCKKWVYVR